MSTTHTIQLSDFIKRMATLGGDVEAAVVRGLQSAALRLDGFIAHEILHAEPYPAVDRSELLNSREVNVTPKGATVAVVAPHAAAINDGTRPFRPPYQPIYEWLVRKKLVEPDEAGARAWAIVEKIARVGIAPRHFMNKAFARLVQGKYVGREVGRELEALAAARGKGRIGNQTRRGTGLRGKKGGDS